MKSGVYQLKFDNSETYIGKSSNITRRWDEHYKALVEGKAARRVQRAYDKYGVPEAIVLMYCHEDHIDLMETVMIRLLRPVLNSASTSELSDEDFDTLQDAGDEILKVSTATHIRTIDSLIEANLELSERCALLESASESAKKIKSLEATVKYLNTKIGEKQKSWWSKILG